MSGKPKKKIKIESASGYVVSIDTKEDPATTDGLFYIHTINLHHKEKLLWSKSYTEQEKPLWRYAHIVPLRKNRYITDLNNDRYEEIAILPWQAGQAHYWTAQIFSIKEDGLVPYGTGRYNLEFGPNVLLNCSDCNRFAPEKCKKCN